MITGRSSDRADGVPLFDHTGRRELTDLTDQRESDRWIEAETYRQSLREVQLTLDAQLKIRN
jgi:hypothetical protein